MNRIMARSQFEVVTHIDGAGTERFAARGDFFAFPRARGLPAVGDVFEQPPRADLRGRRAAGGGEL
jgi:hypothetical protein